MSRDITKAQFEAALARNNMTRAPFGYVNVTPQVAVYARNAGPRLRSQLAYLIREQERAELESRS